MIKQLLFFSLLATTLLGLHAQNDKDVKDSDAIQEAVNAYYKTLSTKEYAKVIQHMPAEALKHQSKEQLIQVIGEEFTYTPTAIEVDRVEIGKVSKTIMTEPDSNKYARVDFTVYLQMKPDPGAVSALSNEEWENIERVMGIKYGAHNVNIMPILSIIEITRPSTMYAIYKKAYKGWKLVEYKESTHDLANKLVPAEVMKGLNKRD